MLNLSEHAFPVASAGAQNELPSSVRNEPSLTTFRHEMKTVLFRLSFDEDWTILIVLHSTAIVWLRLPTVGASVFWFDFVWCPCNVFDMIVSP